MPVPMPLQGSKSFHCCLFLRDFLMHYHGLCLPWGRLLILQTGLCLFYSCTAMDSVSPEVGSLPSRQASVFSKQAPSWPPSFPYRLSVSSSTSRGESPSGLAWFLCLYFLEIGVCLFLHGFQEFIIRSVFVVWKYNDQYPMQFAIRPLLTPVFVYKWLNTVFGLIVGPTEHL
jgi:hypothetical protein